MNSIALQKENLSILLKKILPENEPFLPDS